MIKNCNPSPFEILKFIAKTLAQVSLLRFRTLMLVISVDI